MSSVLHSGAGEVCIPTLAVTGDCRVSGFIINLRRITLQSPAAAITRAVFSKGNPEQAACHVQKARLLQKYPLHTHLHTHRHTHTHTHISLCGAGMREDGGTCLMQHLITSAYLPLHVYFVIHHI